MLRSLFCYFTGHRWSATGVCRVCQLQCSHPVTVHDPAKRTTHCMDCEMTKPFDAHEHKPVVTLGKRTSRQLHGDRDRL
jgi:hypothetical protein